jgi:hypothetical protein
LHLKHFFRFDSTAACATALSKFPEQDEHERGLWCEDGAATRAQEPAANVQSLLDAVQPSAQPPRRRAWTWCTTREGRPIFPQPPHRYSVPYNYVVHIGLLFG